MVQQLQYHFNTIVSPPNQHNIKFQIIRTRILKGAINLDKRKQEQEVQVLERKYTLYIPRFCSYLERKSYVTATRLDITLLGVPQR